ncbi:MAG: FN3 associated domain-containing protein [Bacteroidota bacterium]
MDTLIQLFGRFHPLILHLPIGILVLAFLMEWMGNKANYQTLKSATGFALQIGMWSAIFAALSGYALSLDGGYEETLLNQHQWLGIATALLSVVLLLLHRRKSKIFMPAFTVLMIVLGITGHLGGSLTHGSDFLMAPLQEEAAPPPPMDNLDEAVVFAQFVQPILKDKCVSCHNPSKVKGELLMSTLEGLQKGGKSGALFVAGDARASLMMQRAHLPLEDKKHMPPKGKRQLSESEISLLEWWINGGGDFEKQVAAMEQPEDIKTILARYTQVDNSVWGLEVEEASANKVNALQQMGIKVEKLAAERPFLAVSLSGRQDLNASLLKKLEGIDEQLIHLDLSNTSLDDQLLEMVNDLPHLQKLSLQKTKITSVGLRQLRNLDYLENLNLYDTAIDDEGLANLSQFKALRKLYLWRTNVSPTAIASLEEQQPRLRVNTGVDESIFGSSQLKPPLIVAEKDIFKDSLEVAFEINFKNVDIFYTLDGSAPDSTAQRYEGPFVINQTADIQVIAQKKGWGTSEPAHQLFARARYQPTKIALNKKPNDRYAGKGAKSLCDFKKGTTSFTEGNWLGFEKEHFTATLDLGEPKVVSRVILSTLEDTNSWIFQPKGMTISVSSDGRNFKEVGRHSYPMTESPKPPEVKTFSESFEEQQARFVRVAVKSNLVNPSWHPGAGQPCWVFVDEIMVE